MNNEVVAGPRWADIAASAYRAYAANTGNKNFRGDPMPAFDDLPDAIKQAWQAAVRNTSEILAGAPFGQEDFWATWKAPSL